MNKTILAAAICSLGFAAQASAASRAENAGVFGGAVAGALAGGPIGLVVGATLGAHYGVAVDGRKSEAARADELDHDLGAARDQIETTRAQLSVLGNELATSRNEAARLGAELNEFVRDQALLAELRFDVLFRTNATEPAKADKAQIALLAKFLKRHPELRVKLHGHADIRGGESFNDELSRNRALAVATLLRSMDIGEDRIETRAYGERNASAGEGDLDGYAMDRRVSVEFDVAEQKSPTVAHSD